MCYLIAWYKTSLKLPTVDLFSQRLGIKTDWKGPGIVFKVLGKLGVVAHATCGGTQRSQDIEAVTLPLPCLPGPESDRASKQKVSIKEYVQIISGFLTNNSCCHDNTFFFLNPVSAQLVIFWDYLFELMLEIGENVDLKFFSSLPPSLPLFLTSFFPGNCVNWAHPHALKRGKTSSPVYNCHCRENLRVLARKRLQAVLLWLGLRHRSQSLVA